MGSVDLKDLQPNACWQAFHGGHKKMLVEPAMHALGSFEQGCGPEVHSRWIHRQTGTHALQYCLGRHAQPSRLHIDQRAIGGLDGVARIDDRSAVCAHERPITTSLADMPLKCRARDFATQQGNVLTLTQRTRSPNTYLTNARFDGEYVAKQRRLRNSRRMEHDQPSVVFSQRPMATKRSRTGSQ